MHVHLLGRYGDGTESPAALILQLVRSRIDQAKFAWQLGEYTANQTEVRRCRKAGRYLAKRLRRSRHCGQ